MYTLLRLHHFITTWIHHEIPTSDVLRKLKRRVNFSIILQPLLNSLKLTYNLEIYWQNGYTLSHFMSLILRPQDLVSKLKFKIINLENKQNSWNCLTSKTRGYFTLIIDVVSQNTSNLPNLIYCKKFYKPYLNRKLFSMKFFQFPRIFFVTSILVSKQQDILC